MTTFIRKLLTITTKIVSGDLYKNGIFDDNEYLASYVNMRKYPTILFIMAKIMEMNNQEQNQVALYLYNIIKWKIK